MGRGRCGARSCAMTAGERRRVSLSPQLAGHRIPGGRAAVVSVSGEYGMCVGGECRGSVRIAVTTAREFGSGCGEQSAVVACDCGGRIKDGDGVCTDPPSWPRRAMIFGARLRRGLTFVGLESVDLGRCSTVAVGQGTPRRGLLTSSSGGGGTCVTQAGTGVRYGMAVWESVIEP